MVITATSGGRVASDAGVCRIGYLIATATLLDDREAATLAYCDIPDRIIVMDLSFPVYRSDRWVRSVLLHEMCHAAAGPQEIPHGLAFDAEVDQL